jgi:Seven in absentia protein family
MNYRSVSQNLFNPDLGPENYYWPKYSNPEEVPQEYIQKGICACCSSNIGKCQDCRQLKGHFTIPYIPDLFFEGSVHYCKHQKYGCAFASVELLTKYHESACCYAVVPCILDKIQSCSWIGRIIDVPNHFRKSHDVAGLFMERGRLEALAYYEKVRVSLQARKINDFGMIFRAHKSLFHCVWRNDLEKDVLSWAVYCVGHVEEASRYQFELIFINENDRTEVLKFTGLCYTLPPISIAYDNDYMLKINIDRLRLFCKNGTMNYCVAIKNIHNDNACATQLR